MSTDLSVWTGGIVTVIALSYLYKFNKAYNWVQAAYVGAAAGYGVTLGIQNIVKVGWNPLLSGRIAFVIPLVLGAMLLTQYFKSLRWLAAYPMQLLVGVGTGLSIRGMVSAQVLSQLTASMVPLNNLDNMVVAFTTVTVLGYFVFTFGVDAKTPAGKRFSVFRDLGRYSMMVMLGAGFAMALQSRISLLIGRFQFVFNTWLGF